MNVTRCLALACMLALSMPAVSAAEKSKAKASKASGFQCSKRTCGQMNSCEEAYFHLEKCGVSRLDRDKDGIPCESIC